MRRPQTGENPIRSYAQPLGFRGRQSFEITNLPLSSNETQPHQTGRLGEARAAAR